MSRFDYSSLKEVAERLINRFGKDATLVKAGEPDSDADPWNPGDPEPDESIITLVELQYSLTNRDESLVLKGDKLWLVSTAGLEPDLSDTIKLDGQTYQLIDVQPLNPGGTDLLYEAHGRR